MAALATTDLVLSCVQPSQPLPCTPYGLAAASWPLPCTPYGLAAAGWAPCKYLTSEAMQSTPSLPDSAGPHAHQRTKAKLARLYISRSCCQKELNDSLLDAHAHPSCASLNPLQEQG